MRKTSLQAYHGSRETADKDRIKILKVLARLTKPVNYEVIARKAGIDKHAVGRRNSELMSEKLIKTDGTTSLTSCKKHATNYLIAPKGKRLIEKAA